MANAQNGSESPQMTEQEMMAHLGEALDKMPRDVRIVLFAGDDPNDVFADAARQTLKAFGQISSKIKFEEYRPDHKLAAEWGVAAFPAMVFQPDRYTIHWNGAPVGEEGRTLVELLFLVGFENSNLSDQSRKMMADLDGPRRVKVFVSPSCPYCPQQSVNAVKAAVERPDLVSLEIVDIQANPGIAGEYEAHSVPQTFADDVLVGKGAQSEEIFIQSMIKYEEQRIFIPDIDAAELETDLVIVGGGPAGLTAGIYAKRAGLETALVEKGMLGGQVATTPVVENYPGFTSVGGKTLVDIMVNHALEYVTIFQGEEVVGIEPGKSPGDPIEVTTSRRKFRTRAVLLATGANHRHLGVPGENRFSGRGVSYCATCDGPLFKGKKVLMAGGGNSAVTEALYLHHMGADVTLVHRRNKLRAQDHLSKNLFDTGVPVLWDAEIKEIRGRERVTSVVLTNNKSGQVTEVPADGVFVSIGYEPAVALAKEIGVELTKEGYIKRDDRHRTNIPGIYSGGDVEGGYKQIVTAAGQGSEAAMAIFEDLINPYWKEAVAV
jgi:thioredoxin reductase (NADPH)